MADLHLIAATVQKLLSHTTVLLQQSRIPVVQDEILETLERDTRLAMMHLRRCRNESLPIPVNRLPPELLRMVLGHLRPPPYIRGARHLTPLTIFASYKPLVTAMLVCHKWSAIASRAASLWTDIDFHRQRTFAPVLLARSLGAAIHLCGHLKSEDDTFAKAIEDNGARIRELDLWAGDSEPALQSILAVDMPRVRLLCLSCESENSTRASTVLIDAAPSFPALKAMLLESFLFVPAHVLPQLTHLHLAKMDRVNAMNVLDLLRNTPVLEVLDIGSSGLIVPPNSTAVPSSVSLPRLQSSCLSRLASTAVSYLMTALEVPSLVLLDLSKIFATPGEALSSTPLLPDALTTCPMRRLVLDVGSDFASFHARLHGSGTSLAIGLSTFGIPDDERPQWAFTFRAMLPPLSGVEECHVQARQWDAPHDLLPHLAAYLPGVSTLLIKHDPVDDDDDEEDIEGTMALARTVARVLENDSPVLFPHLAHLQLIVSCIPRAFCKVLARALARRAEAGRRLRKLRIRIDGEYIFQWRLKMDGRREPDYRNTGIFDHVDLCEISDDFMDSDDDPQRLGWGRWKDCVQRAGHEYWRE